MNLIELNRSLVQLRLSGMAAVMETRLVEAQSEDMVCSEAGAGDSRGGGASAADVLFDPVCGRPHRQAKSLRPVLRVHEPPDVIPVCSILPC